MHKGASAILKYLQIPRYQKAFWCETLNPPKYFFENENRAELMWEILELISLRLPFTKSTLRALSLMTPVSGHT